jgi:leucine dehydrogenase
MNSVLSQEIPASIASKSNSSFHIVKIDVDNHIDFDHHEVVYRCQDEDSGLIAFIGIHNRNRGPAVGGCRMWNYQSEDDAITDVLRLSRGMTYKNSVSSLDFGGGKAVIFGVPSDEKREAVLEAFGQFVNALEGRYYTAEYVGISPTDMSIVKRNTNFVYGLSEISGDPSPYTAFGVYQGIKAACEKKYGSDSLKNKRVLVQGIGHVGYFLCEYLHQDGAQLLVCDLNQSACEKAKNNFNAEIVFSDQLFGLAIDIYAPCALGGTLSAEFVNQFTGDIVSGAANNQLVTPSIGDLMHEKGVLYAPDYVINAGGIINISFEPDYSPVAAKQRVAKIRTTLRDLFERSESENVPTYRVADEMALENLKQ